MDQPDELSGKCLELLRESSCAVPQNFYLEMVQVLGSAERRKRLSAKQTDEFLTELDALPIQMLQAGHHRILRIVREFQISAYDAAYLALALQDDLPLATYDHRLVAACLTAGGALL